MRACDEEASRENGDEENDGDGSMPYGRISLNIQTLEKSGDADCGDDDCKRKEYYLIADGCNDVVCFRSGIVEEDKENERSDGDGFFGAFYFSKHGERESGNEGDEQYGMESEEEAVEIGADMPDRLHNRCRLRGVLGRHNDFLEIKPSHSEPRIHERKHRNRQEHSGKSCQDNSFEFREKRQNGSGYFSARDKSIDYEKCEHARKERPGAFESGGKYGTFKDHLGLDPCGGEERGESNDGDCDQNTKVSKRSFEKESDFRLLGIEDIFEKRENKEENKEDIRDVFGEEGKSGQYAGKEEISPFATFSVGEAGENGEGEKYPEESVGIDNEGNPENDRGESDTDGRKNGDGRAD